MPKRIQRKRTKGWRMPENTVYVGRPTKWGNPYSWKDYDLMEESTAKKRSVRQYKHWIKGQIVRGKVNLEELRGKDLACWCKKGDPCHADVLISIISKFGNREGQQVVCARVREMCDVFAGRMDVTA